jgi:hypothetical protein
VHQQVVLPEIPVPALAAFDIMLNSYVESTMDMVYRVMDEIAAKKAAKQLLPPASTCNEDIPMVGPDIPHDGARP